jgi:hypothetical protein
VLTEVDDVHELAAGLEFILSLPDDKWRKMSQSAYETATSGSWEKSAALFEQALRRAHMKSRYTPNI